MILRRWPLNGRYSDLIVSSKPTTPTSRVRLRETRRRAMGRGGSDGGRVLLVGDLPQNDPPHIPETEPASARLRNVVVKIVARAASHLELLIRAPTWLYQFAPYIMAYNDAPASLQELQSNVSSPQRDYDIHHIVEQSAAERDGFPRSMIDGPDNLVRISTLKHWEINAWFQTQNSAFDNQSPRDYLRYKSWEQRRDIGLSALRKFEVLTQ